MKDWKQSKTLFYIDEGYRESTYTKHVMTIFFSFIEIELKIKIVYIWGIQCDVLIYKYSVNDYYNQVTWYLPPHTVNLEYVCVCVLGDGGWEHPRSILLTDFQVNIIIHQVIMLYIRSPEITYNWKSVPFETFHNYCHHHQQQQQPICWSLTLFRHCVKFFTGIISLKHHKLLWGRYYYYFHFTDWDTEAHKIKLFVQGHQLIRGRAEIWTQVRLYLYLIPK